MQKLPESGRRRDCLGIIPGLFWGCAGCLGGRFCPFCGGGSAADRLWDCLFVVRFAISENGLSYPLRCYAPPPLTIRGGMKGSVLLLIKRGGMKGGVLLLIKRGGMKGSVLLLTKRGGLGGRRLRGTLSIKVWLAGKRRGRREGWALFSLTIRGGKTAGSLAGERRRGKKEKGMRKMIKGRKGKIGSRNGCLLGGDVV